MCLLLFKQQQQKFKLNFRIFLIVRLIDTLNAKFETIIHKKTCAVWDVDILNKDEEEKNPLDDTSF